MALCKATEGCSKEGKKLGLCGTHYMQVQRGARHVDGHLLRELRATYAGNDALCSAPDCKRVPYANGFCTRHNQLFRFARIDAAGQPTDPAVWKSYFNPNRKTPGTAGPCRVAECNRQKAYADLGLCAYHMRRFELGICDSDGNLLRETYRVQRYESTDLCKVPGCSKQARSNFFCLSHVGAFHGGRIDADGQPLGTKSSGRAPRGMARHLSTDGYVLVSAPEGHPNASAEGTMFEHRLVMETHLGRYLEKHELVHHKDSNRQNNALDNLELRTRRTHPPGGEYTQELLERGMEALRHNDPEAYARLLQGLKN